MDKATVKQWLSTLPPEELAEFGINTGGTVDQDAYADSVVSKAMEAWNKQYGPIVGTMAQQSAMDRLTKGLTPRAAAILEERLKDKPADHLLALANEPTYSTLFRNGAEADASKEAAEAEAAANVTVIDAGEGKKAASSTEVEEFKRTMKEQMGVEFTDEEAAQAVKDAKEASVSMGVI